MPEMHWQYIFSSLQQETWPEGPYQYLTNNINNHINNHSLKYWHNIMEAFSVSLEAK